VDRAVLDLVRPRKVRAVAAAPDAGIVAEQARTIEALKAEKAEVNAKNAKLNAENAELKAEVATLKDAGAVATPRQLAFAAEPTSLANPPSRMTYSGTDPSFAWFPHLESYKQLSRSQSRCKTAISAPGHTMCSSSHHYSTDDGVDGTHLILQIQYTSVRNYNTATGLTEDQCINNCIDGTWANCVGFSRYTDQSTVDDDDDDGFTDGTARASCWWVTRFSDGFIFNDDNGARRFRSQAQTRYELTR
jgi:hypothetical protein